MLWDTVANTAVCRLKGHKSPITDIHFMEQHPYLLSSAKDSLIKVWDLQNYRCCSTLVGHKAEVGFRKLSLCSWFLFPFADL